MRPLITSSTGEPIAILSASVAWGGRKVECTDQRQVSRDSLQRERSVKWRKTYDGHVHTTAPRYFPHPNSFVCLKISLVKCLTWSVPVTPGTVPSTPPSEQFVTVSGGGGLGKTHR